MRHIILLVLGMMAFSATAMAQMPAAQPDAIALPLLALPEGLRADAGVVKWKPDFTYDTLKEGKSEMVCFDRSGFPRQAKFSMMCTVKGNLPREVQNLKAEAEAQGDRAKSEAALDAMEKNGTRLKPVYGSIWYHFAGEDREHARPHQTIAVPGATAQSTGLPDKRTSDTIWIMNAGTSTAHIMVPGE